MAEQKQSLIRRLLGLDPAFSMGQRGLDLYSLLKTSGVLAGGGLMYYLGTLTEWARALGPLGIGLIALAASIAIWLTIVVGQLLLAKRAVKKAEASATDKWQERVD